MRDYLRHQRSLQVESFGIDPGRLDGEEFAEYVRWNTLAATDELHEALREVPWKPWKRGQEAFNRDMYVKELVDVLHFVGNLLLAAGVDDNELSRRYHAKREINAKRQREGY